MVDLFKVGQPVIEAESTSFSAKVGSKLLEWKCYERMGTPVCRVRPDGLLDLSVRRHGLRPGDQLIVHGLFGHHLMTVDHNDDMDVQGSATGEGMHASLMFDEQADEWVCIGMASLEAIRRLNLEP